MELQTSTKNKSAVMGTSAKIKQGVAAKHSQVMPKSKKKKVIVGALLGMMMKNKIKS